MSVRRVNISGLQRPFVVGHKQKGFFHNQRKCVDVRNGKVHCIKANTKPNGWHNVVDADRAEISINPKTLTDNGLVWNSTYPFHLISYGRGPNTHYWGRYRCVGGRAQQKFLLEYVDDGVAKRLDVDQLGGHRSRLEGQWTSAFEQHNVKHSYEPATMLISRTCEYTPDYWLPDAKEFIEIKGPEPTEAEFEKCRQTRLKGFPIKLFRGPPTCFDVYDWDSDGKRIGPTRYGSVYRYLHPAPKRKRRKLVNM